MTSKIEWTDETDNPITVKGGRGHWCRKISEGCANCYAEAINTGNRFDFASGLTYTGKAPELELNYKMLAGWARKRVPKRRFVCSMTDWCGEWIHRDWQISMLDAMISAPSQTFMLLTKRADILEDVVTQNFDESNLKNVWFGVSVENQNTANIRLPYLAEMNQAGFNTFVSLEPLLAPVLLGDYAKYIDLAIVGAESGKGARPMDEDWVRSLRDEIKAANKAFFYKQNVVNGRKISLPELDGKVWSELP
jgi:protein gp37